MKQHQDVGIQQQNLAGLIKQPVVGLERGITVIVHKSLFCLSCPCKWFKFLCLIWWVPNISQIIKNDGKNTDRVTNTSLIQTIQEEEIIIEIHPVVGTSDQQQNLLGSQPL